MPVEEITDTVCGSISYPWYGQNLTASGVYEHLLQSSPCDTLLQLDLTFGRADTLKIDTLLAEGEQLELYDLVFTEPGTYEVILPDGGICGTTVIIQLDFTTSVTTNQVPFSEYWYPSLIQHNGGKLDFHPTAAQTTVTLESLAIFDLRGRRIFTSKSGTPWQPDYGLAVGVYIFKARLSVDGKQVYKTGRVVLTR